MLKGNANLLKIEQQTSTNMIGHMNADIALDHSEETAKWKSNGNFRIRGIIFQKKSFSNKNGSFSLSSVFPSAKGF